MKLAAFTALALVASLGAVGCSGKQSRQRAAAPVIVEAEPEAAPVVEPEAPAPVVVAMAEPAPQLGVPTDFPPDCVGYAALVDRLAGCEKMADARDGIALSYQELRADWSNGSADRFDAMNAQCKTRAESLVSAVAATCGW